ncbi:hypothetical protein [Micromonospora chersina]|uniref:hypothetical protein n=1 Tax=Micromonospora chersina TaxID=47854 RepID=UPI003D912150
MGDLDLRELGDRRRGLRQRLRGADDEEPAGTLPRLGLALAAGVGALITVLLVAVPARAARVPATSSPQAVAAGYAVAGLVLGVLLATWALHTRAAATNLVATTGWLWLLAVVSVLDGVLSGRGLTTAQLGIWQISADSGRFWIRDYFYWPGALLSLGSALLIGILAARGAVRVPERRVGAAASGAAGPLLVALAYLLAVPRLAGIAAEQVSAHLIAPYAVIAGVGGSVLVAALAQRADRRAAERAVVNLPRQRTGEPDQLTADDPEPAAGPAEGTEPPAERPARRFFGRRASTPGAERAAGPAPATSVDPVGEQVTSVGTLREAETAGQRDANGRTGSSPDPTAAAGATSADPETAPGRTAASRRGRAVPPQRKPESSFPAGTGPAVPEAATGGPAGSATAERAGDSEPGSGATAPTTGPKARRRNR